MPCGRPPAGGPTAVTLRGVGTRSRVVVPGLLATSLMVPALLTGCSGGGQGGSSSSGPSSTGASSSGAPTTAGGTAGSSSAAAASDTDAVPSEPPFPANTEPDTGEASPGAQVTVRAIRIGAHDGFDRVVFEAGGKGTPGWNVRYVGRALSQGSGKPVAVAGKAVLQVTITGVGYPTETGVAEYSGPDHLSAAGTQAVREVVFDSTFEGTTVAFIGTAATTPFRVYALDAPARVVVEVADKG
jgi:hypothetical protein